ncbi:SCO1664 family protein [Mycobacterium avium subsp. hominissuis]|uniref:SCO1664 family protein n=2 Tax=Mycobacterium avium TaxID=1764 RepID=A0A3B6XEH3_MYCAV|nr:SCO1664 family protein [Mycobacterium avium]ETZ39671.1 phosphatidylinositol 3- and 4-kinase family protein [Mycobacterium avium MAV_120809_2495]APA75721.2 SCO1664 family protein [Mycobacterium avium subsp. hominissuis]ATO65248.1 SCO1664 family protein [Mycobacterium avium subsp. hominissuis]ATO67916.2 SCO1664 family protein [Mycobacterium avium subsp. hominissuis]ATO74284.1 SCO1664 family protein [Mycobacterium avium subsp. hominissuis]
MLRDGELTVIGRIRSASNATFLCEATLGDRAVHCVYKPVAGEAPLWDFPDGTLAGRELGAYLVSTQLGWNLVPYTVIRDGPAGPGMLQLWVRQAGDAVGEVSEAGESGAEQPDPGPDLVDLFPVGASPPGYLPVLRAYDYAGDEVVLMHADDPGLRRMAVFDVLVNNADRKGGHILCGVDGRVYGVDHGVCLHVENKLRTVLWGWAGKPVDDDTLAAVACLAEALTGPFGDELAEQITRAEIAALRLRAHALLDNPVMPGPNRHRPIPWPAF